MAIVDQIGQKQLLFAALVAIVGIAAPVATQAAAPGPPQIPIPPAPPPVVPQNPPQIPLPMGPKIASFSINSGATVTDARTIVFEFTLAPSMVHATQYRMSERSDFSDATWLPIVSPRSFVLSVGNAAKIVHFQVRGPAPDKQNDATPLGDAPAPVLVTSAIAKDDIRLQTLGFTAQPTKEVVIGGDGRRSVAITFLVADRVSPTSVAMSLSLGDAQCFSAPSAFSIPAGQTSKIIQIPVRDPLPSSCLTSVAGGSNAIHLPVMLTAHYDFGSATPPQNPPSCSIATPCSTVVTGFSINEALGVPHAPDLP